MATISTQLRKSRDPTKDELTRHFFAIPDEEDEHGVKSKSMEANSGGSSGLDYSSAKEGQIEVNAVLSLGQDGVEDSYVSNLCYLLCYWVGVFLVMHHGLCVVLVLCGFRRGNCTCYHHS